MKKQKRVTMYYCDTCGECLGIDKENVLTCSKCGAHLCYVHCYVFVGSVEGVREGMYKEHYRTEAWKASGYLCSACFSEVREVLSAYTSVIVFSP